MGFNIPAPDAYESFPTVGYGLDFFVSAPSDLGLCVLLCVRLVMSVVCICIYVST